ncbi:Aspartate aminotransferase, mitochondrial [Seminavis robusta]|uniref:aspartate transaminase n=1 Tax=Seminavis robusta TaxID=568900 RepID=A0A9N8ELH6_9STRA|nr:Aspartate aminotransferase, mitochondrial [Seminavis robusta]|eukprot:Sro1481_g276220.1 Aspartate aminotransferase, mitochondrial (438) ;mRNA; r:12201-13514
MAKATLGLISVFLYGWSVVCGFSLDASTPTKAAASLWQDVPQGPPDAILGIAQAFRACEDPKKVNVCVGAYRTSEGNPWVLPSVRKAEGIMLENNEIKEYLPIEGDAAFVEKALQFAYGKNAPLDRIAGVQTLSGTGACRIGGAFLNAFLPGRTIYIPDPSWGNHKKIFEACGLTVQTYRYYERSQNGLDFEGMLEDIQTAPKGSIMLLHACAHNPTGCDPTPAQWQQIYQSILERDHVAFFDSAYQGFASGDSEQDAGALRAAVDAGLPVLLAQSFAKNFGLYGERCGTLSVVCGTAAQKDLVMSQLKCIIRPMYSSPPRHGSSIVKTVLSDEPLTEQYYEECASMANRIVDMRTKLVEKLHEVGSTHDWSHVTQQIGMFAFTGMSSDMCDQLTEEYSIFLTRDGRISIAGLNDNNLEYVAKAVHAVTDGKSITSN